MYEPENETIIISVIYKDSFSTSFRHWNMNLTLRFTIHLFLFTAVFLHI